MIAAAGSEVMAIDRYAYLVGGADGGPGAQDGVVDAHRVYGVPNRYITDGSTLPGSATDPPTATGRHRLSGRAIRRWAAGAGDGMAVT